jgi:hypothetical protein
MDIEIREEDFHPGDIRPYAAAQYRAIERAIRDEEIAERARREAERRQNSFGIIGQAGEPVRPGERED